MKQYRFDYLDEMVEKWVDKSDITMASLHMLPWCIKLPYIMPYGESKPPYDYYNEVINDMDEWKKQRDEHLKVIYEKYNKSN